MLKSSKLLIKAGNASRHNKERKIMIAMNTREAARNVARKVNAVAPAKLKAPVKGENGWIFPGLSHADGKGTLTLKK